MPNNEDEIGEELKEEEEMEIEDINEEETRNGEELLAEKIKPKKQNKQPIVNQSENVEVDENCAEERIDVDGEVILTQTAERGMDTMFLTKDLNEEDEAHSVTVKDVKDHKEYLKNQNDRWFEVSQC